jgi:hypothetical protein
MLVESNHHRIDHNNNLFLLIKRYPQFIVAQKKFYLENHWSQDISQTQDSAFTKNT